MYIDRFFPVSKVFNSFTHENESQIMDPLKDIEYGIWWGINKDGRGSVFESGFFWDAFHLDKLGLYQFSSLNVPEIKYMIQSCRPFDRELLLNGPRVNSKYRQTNVPTEWDGVVLACQNPGDRSVISVGTMEDYYNFIDDACRYYGSKLFLKLHPWNSGEVVERFQVSADRYGCKMAKTNHSVLDNCEFALMYNSTFAVDCMLRGVPVVQYAPSYFTESGSVTHSKRQFIAPHDTVVRGYKMIDFLVQHYCFTQDMSPADWTFLLRSHAESTNLFPLPRRLSYGEYLKRI